MLPNFVIIGTSRSGTTFLKRTIEQHPDVFMGGEGAYTGDIHFFNPEHPAKNWQKGITWYESFFTGRSNEKAIGQKGAQYFSNQEAPKLIHQVLGDKVKLICSLRNPMERAYSSYWYQIEDIPKGMDFLTACKMEQAGQLQLPSKLVSPGLYYKHLENLLQYTSKEQLLFILFEDIQNNPLKTLQKTFLFLGIDDTFIPDNYDKKVNQATGNEGFLYRVRLGWGTFKQRWPAGYAYFKSKSPAKWLRYRLGKSCEKAAGKKGYPPMTLSEWQYLENFYYESNQRMGDFLGVDLLNLWHDPSKHLSKSINRTLT